MPINTAVRPEIHIVIPARLQSTRLPGKVLHKRTGKSMLQHAYEAAKLSELARGVTIATSDREIAREARSFGADVVMTQPQPNGTSRVAEAARGLDADTFVDLQADWPEAGQHIDELIRFHLDMPCAMATLATEIEDIVDWLDSNVVKVVISKPNLTALYFSRAPIPSRRAYPSQRSPALRHLGIYIYRREFLFEYLKLGPSDLEINEDLEQLRVLEAGYDIAVKVIRSEARGLDTDKEYDAFISREAKRSG